LEELPESSGEGEKVTWDEYFQFKRRRVLIQRGVGIPLAFGGLAGTFLYASTLELDGQPIMGMDPMVLLVAGSLTATIAGFFVGTLGTGIAWRFIYAKKIKAVDKMDKEFFERIARLRCGAPNFLLCVWVCDSHMIIIVLVIVNRAQPNPLVLNNPPPDYYGEKIKSVSEFRDWIRKQREYAKRHSATKPPPSKEGPHPH